MNALGILAGLFRAFIAGVLLAALCATPAAAISDGQNAPRFSVSSGDDKTLTSEMLKGKIVVMFYEARSAIEVNRPLKNALNAFFAAQSPAVQKDVARVAIVRCSNFFPTTWRRSLREHSKQEGITIYGDWDGSMEKDYGMASDSSNFLIIDRAGVVKYAENGAVPKEEFPAIEKLLDGLSR
ncbi:MAG: redoxin domain-containing protein [Candidatus Omnitrophica bacterium]|nr:redoxin domain-containing protein [Candidatus Omnitrophota bacterium]